MEKKKSIALSFVLVTACFALWGFANNVTDPMVRVFSKIFSMSTTDGALVQVAFYLGYFVLALPAAIFIRKHSYRSGILVGLCLFAAGAFLFIPAAKSGLYYPFLLAYFVLTCGLSFLETSANPYIVTMGDPRNAIYRLNLAQAFNPLGVLAGMFVAMKFVQERISPLSFDERCHLTVEKFEEVKMQDLNILAQPYIYLGIVVVVVAVILFIIPIHSEEKEGVAFNLGSTISRVLRATNYKSGFIAQFFYVGAQIMCWTYIIHYGTQVFTAQGMSEVEAEVMSQKYNIGSALLFATSRFACTFLMKVISPAKLFTTLSIAAFLLTIGVITIGGETGLICLVLISACMSLMFPTIYSIALSNLDAQDAKIGAAGQIMAILGGSLLPLLQAYIIDSYDVQISFVVPLLSFLVVTIFAFNYLDKVQSY